MYNGWTNYETWNLALWIGNDPSADDYWRERTQEVYRNAVADEAFTRRQRAAFDLAEELKTETNEQAPEVTGFYADVLSAAISGVNWREIAEHWIDAEADDIDAEESAEAQS